MPASKKDIRRVEAMINDVDERMIAGIDALVEGMNRSSQIDAEILKARDQGVGLVLEDLGNRIAALEGQDPTLEASVPSIADEPGFDSPMSAERECDVSGEEGARDTLGEPAQDSLSTGEGHTWWTVDGERWVTDRVSDDRPQVGDVTFLQRGAASQKPYQWTEDFVIRAREGGRWKRWFLRPAKTFEGGPTGKLIETGDVPVSGGWALSPTLGFIHEFTSKCRERDCVGLEPVEPEKYDDQLEWIAKKNAEVFELATRAEKAEALAASLADSVDRAEKRADEAEEEAEQNRLGGLLFVKACREKIDAIEKAQFILSAGNESQSMESRISEAHGILKGAGQ